MAWALEWASGWACGSASPLGPEWALLLGPASMWAPGLAWRSGPPSATPRPWPKTWASTVPDRSGAGAGAAVGTAGALAAPQGGHNRQAQGGDRQNP